MTTKEGNLLNIKELCQIAGVSRSGYYNWISAEPYRLECEEKDRADFEKILEAFNHRGYDKGVNGIHMRLLHTGTLMNVKKVRRLINAEIWFEMQNTPGKSISADNEVT